MRCFDLVLKWRTLLLDLHCSRMAPAGVSVQGATTAELIKYVTLFSGRSSRFLRMTHCKELTKSVRVHKAHTFELSLQHVQTRLWSATLTCCKQASNNDRHSNSCIFLALAQTPSKAWGCAGGTRRCF